MNLEVLLAATDLKVLPRALQDKPRIKAKIKQYPSDFEVEEVPLYAPSGHGDHLFIWVEKVDCSGGDLLAKLAAVLRIPIGDIGFAGTKDKRAVTRQWLSVPAECEAIVRAGINLEGIRVLKVARHRHKLRLGHLAGNRFRILLRGDNLDHLAYVEEAAQILEKRGFPNFFGEQRFGKDGSSVKLGVTMLSKEASEVPNLKRIGRFERRMAISAVQSAVFNLYLAERIERGLAHRVLKGDICERVSSGGLFVAEDVESEQARLEKGDIVITGPVPGFKMPRPVAESWELECSVFEKAQISPAFFEKFHRLGRGTRRALFVRPMETKVEPDDDGIVLSFFLPKGSFASVMLREFVEDY